MTPSILHLTLFLLAAALPRAEPEPPPEKHVLRVEAPGWDRIPIEGYYAFDDATPLVHVEGVTTPFTVKTLARTVCARFRSLDPERPIVLFLRKPREKAIGHVVKVPALRAEVRWSAKRRGPRAIGNLAEWSVPRTCADIAGPASPESEDAGEATGR